MYSVSLFPPTCSQLPHPVLSPSCLSWPFSSTFFPNWIIQLSMPALSSLYPFSLNAILPLSSCYSLPILSHLTLPVRCEFSHKPLRSSALLCLLTRHHPSCLPLLLLLCLLTQLSLIFPLKVSDLASLLRHPFPPSFASTCMYKHRVDTCLLCMPSLSPPSLSPLSPPFSDFCPLSPPLAISLPYALMPLNTLYNYVIITHYFMYNWQINSLWWWPASWGDYWVKARMRTNPNI